MSNQWKHPSFSYVFVQPCPFIVCRITASEFFDLNAVRRVSSVFLAHCLPAADPTARPLISSRSGHDTAESGRDNVIVSDGNTRRSLLLSVWFSAAAACISGLKFLFDNFYFSVHLPVIVRASHRNFSYAAFPIDVHTNVFPSLFFFFL